MKYEAIKSLLEKLVQEIHQKHEGNPLAIGYSFVHANPDILPNLASNRTSVILDESDILQQKANIFFDRWSNPDSDPRCVIKRTHIPKPFANETLLEYLSSLQANAPNISNTSWWRSLHQFINFLRSYYKANASVEKIFPKEMGAFHEQIAHRISLTAYPIDIIHAGKIIEQLINDVLTVRANARKNTLQALALSWICLTASKIRLPTQLRMLSEISKDTLLEGLVAWLSQLFLDII